MPVSPKEIDSAKLYTVTETARLLAITEQTVRKHLSERLMNGKKMGRRWLVKGTEIQKFIGE
jgi:excisionase family DNA binding protein